MEWTSIVDVAHDADITVGDESNDVITCAIQLKDYAGNDLSVESCIYAYFSGDSDGADIVATTFSGGIDSGTDGDYIVGATSGVDMHLISESDGDIDVAITESTATHTSYLVLVMPSGKLVVSDAITFAA